jgi:hypothetical protein
MSPLSIVVMQKSKNRLIDPAQFRIQFNENSINFHRNARSISSMKCENSRSRLAPDWHIYTRDRCRAGVSVERFWGQSQAVLRQRPRVSIIAEKQVRFTFNAGRYYPASRKRTSPWNDMRDRAIILRKSHASHTPQGEIFWQALWRLPASVRCGRNRPCSGFTNYGRPRWLQVPRSGRGDRGSHQGPERKLGAVSFFAPGVGCRRPQSGDPSCGRGTNSSPKQ